MLPVIYNGKTFDYNLTLETINGNEFVKTKRYINGYLLEDEKFERFSELEKTLFNGSDIEAQYVYFQFEAEIGEDFFNVTDIEAENGFDISDALYDIIEEGINADRNAYIEAYIEYSKRNYEG